MREPWNISLRVDGRWCLHGVWGLERPSSLNFVFHWFVDEEAAVMEPCAPAEMRPGGSSRHPASIGSEAWKESSLMSLMDETIRVLLLP